MRKVSGIFIFCFIFVLNLNASESVLIDDFKNPDLTHYQGIQYNDLYGDRGVGSDNESGITGSHPMPFSISTIYMQSTSKESVGDDDWDSGALKIEYNQVYEYYYLGGKYNGYCYFYETLVPQSMSGMATNWLIGTNFSYFSFWAKRIEGDMDFAVKFKLDDGTYTKAVPISGFIYQPVSSGWEKIKIPMEQFLGDNGKGDTIDENNFLKLEGVSFDFSYHSIKSNINNSSGSFYIDNIMLIGKNNDTLDYTKKGNLIKEFIIKDPAILVEKDDNYIGNQIIPIRFSLTETADVEIKIFNKGKSLIKVFENTSYSAGSHAIEWDLKDLFNREIPPGIYLILIAAHSDSYNETLKSSFLLIK